ncbi:MAG: YtxH domain-containing protein [Deltaproteobacteria bacterium]|nr:YtxH domain-containing protein [Deltaproteobacteria bacterium]
MSDEKGGYVKDVLIGGIIGGFLGAVIGLLYAPKSGKETREDLGKKAGEFIVKAKEEYEHLIEHVVKEKAAELEDKVTELKELGKQTVEKQKGRIGKAVAAGVAAYKEEKERQ